MFVVLHAKIIDNKDTLQMEGPFVGPEYLTMADAHQASRTLVSSNKDLVLVKIYDLNEITKDQAVKAANQHFKSTFELSQEAVTYLDKPIRKRGKRLPKPKPGEFDFND